MKTVFLYQLPLSEIEANRVTQVKTLENDGYTAVQVTTGSKKANRVTKPQTEPFRESRCWKLVAVYGNFVLKVKKFTLGQEINVDIFADVKK